MYGKKKHKPYLSDQRLKHRYGKTASINKLAFIVKKHSTKLTEIKIFENYECIR